MAGAFNKDWAGVDFHAQGWGGDLRVLTTPLRTQLTLYAFIQKSFYVLFYFPVVLRL